MNEWYIIGLHAHFLWLAAFCHGHGIDRDHALTLVLQNLRDYRHWLCDGTQLGAP